ncbi:UDP-glucose/GDP-mannose dehydrogenase family protein [Halobacillus sp. BBL2006]|uniref:UDP-glucose dehydrogenase family protein n=1 Tax=Halobacillus sp. BBL2006 TaxID=1543706 RepID=UPI0005427194|nr:UDP-glucose/GDP-mannose dehydrogenase family protein [Halobacillus sp. BBL2006]KHE73049.1 UDP-glucose 6-dehydrogenase [Halobacillus sp. BBL2006]
MKKLAIIGTGYVGLVTGVCLAHVGYHVTCIDIDLGRIKKLSNGQCPIYEPELEKLMKLNMEKGNLEFTSTLTSGIQEAEAIFIAVGTPQRTDGSAELKFIQKAVFDIGMTIRHDLTVIVKSTVPVGTCDMVKRTFETLQPSRQIHVVSNPEFLREGSAINDMFYGDRIVIGADHREASIMAEAIYAPFSVPIFCTDVRTAELIKYSSNAFLATKISFINEISTICDKLGANIEDVAMGMGMDKRIGEQFLKAGIGYGGSCFPKDTQALVQMADQLNEDFHLLKSVIQVNQKQRGVLVEKAVERFGSLKGKRVAVLGLSFKPDTDDLRESPALTIIDKLLAEEADVVAFDPAAQYHTINTLKIPRAETIETALKEADLAMIVTEWKEFVNLPLSTFKRWMKSPVIFDGRNCYPITNARNEGIEYHSIGRASTFSTPMNNKDFAIKE